MPIKGPQDLSLSNRLIWDAVSGKQLLRPDYPYWVDVRDVGRAHVEALQRNEARAKKFIVTKGSVVYSDVIFLNFVIDLFLRKHRADLRTVCGYCNEAFSGIEAFE